MKSEDIIPKKFEFSYGYALLHGMPDLELKDGKFVEEFPFYHGFCTPLEIEPAKEQWIEFWKKIDEIGIWNWNEDYDTADFLDGIEWRIKIVLGDRKIESCGSNAYPDLNPKNIRRVLTPTFEGFLYVFKKLTGIDMLKENERRGDICCK